MYLSRILTRNIGHYESFSQNYQRLGPFTATSSICNQSSLTYLTNLLSKGLFSPFYDAPDQMSIPLKKIAWYSFLEIFNRWSCTMHYIKVEYQWRIWGLMWLIQLCCCSSVWRLPPLASMTSKFDADDPSSEDRGQSLAFEDDDDEVDVDDLSVDFVKEWVMLSSKIYC